VRDDWLRAQDRKRKLLAWGLAGLAYLLAGGIVVLRSVFGYETLSSGMGTIQIRIGTPEGEDEFSRIIPALSSGKGSAAMAEASAAAGEIPAPAEAPADTRPEPAALPPPEETLKATPQALAAPAAAEKVAKPSQGAAKPASSSAAAASAPAAAAAASSGGQGQTASQPGAVLTPSETGIPTGSPTGSGSVSLKGSEAGNSFETNFDTGSGKISRSLYVPIYLYMPLPVRLDKALYDAVPASKFGEPAELRKARLRDIYDMRGTLLTLKDDVALKDRPAVWVILEDAGYPLGKADYKSGRDLRPIVIEFSVGAPAAGYPEIDAAVLYAFRMAGFSNNSRSTVKGRFTYNFSN
jgi:hypothetical protein